MSETETQTQTQKPKKNGAKRILILIFCIGSIYVMRNDLRAGDFDGAKVTLIIFFVLVVLVVMIGNLQKIKNKQLTNTDGRTHLKYENRRYERRTVNSGSREETVRPSNAEDDYGHYMTDEEYLRRSNRYNE